GTALAAGVWLPARGGDPCEVINLTLNRIKRFNGVGRDWRDESLVLTVLEAVLIAILRAAGKELVRDQIQ
ncbi:MAG: hypothetical protein ACHRXM_39655, partial [Isosphaerales bacterium]